MRTNTVEAHDREGATWHPCQGEVRHLVHRLKRHHRVLRVRKAGLFGLLAALGLFYYVASADVSARIQSRVAGSDCDRYMAEMRAYYCDKTVTELEPKLWEHLSTCSDCRKDFTLCTCMAHSGVARGTPHKHGHALVPAANQPISFNEFLERATLAASR